VTDPLPISRSLTFEREPGVTDIRIETGVALVVVHCVDQIPQQRLQVLALLAEARVPVNQVKLQPSGLTFVIGENHATVCLELLQSEKTDVAITTGMALVSIIAGAMRDLSGVIARICEALLATGILNRQVGDAYDAVLFLVPAVDAPKAVVALRAQFQRGHVRRHGRSPTAGRI
jgi:aspartokinase